MHCLTTQKLSFLPIPKVLPKASPFVQKGKFEVSKEKMDFQTTQQLSYVLPGYYIKGHNCSCLEYKEKTTLDDAPRAAIC